MQEGTVALVVVVIVVVVVAVVFLRLLLLFSFSFVVVVVAVVAAVAVAVLTLLWLLLLGSTQWVPLISIILWRLQGHQVLPDQDFVAHWASPQPRCPPGFHGTPELLRNMLRRAGTILVKTQKSVKRWYS